MKTVTTIFIALALAGCATIDGVLDPWADDAAEKVADYIIDYCDKLDADTRASMRDRVIARSNGNTVVITCANDQ